MAGEWKVGEFTVKPLLERRPGMAEYTEALAAQVRALNIEKKPPSTVQQPSTQATLDRDPAKDAEHWNRPLPKEVVEKNKQLVEAYRAGDLATLDHLVDARNVTPDEYILIDGLRKKPKNSIGQTTFKGASDAAIEKAVHSFLFSPPAQLTPEERKRITEMTPYSPPPMPIVEIKEEKKTLAGHFMHYLWKMGLPVYKATKKELSVDVADGLATDVKKTKPQ